MATVLNEFLVSLGFQIDHDSEAKFKASIDGARNAAIKMSAAVVAAATAGGVALVKLSSNLNSKFFGAQFAGSTVANIEKLGLAFKLLGGNMQDALSVLTTMANNIRNMPAFEAVIKRWNVATRDANGNLRDTKDIFTDLMREMQKKAAQSPAGLAQVREELRTNFGMNDQQINIVLNPKFLDKVAEADKLVKSTGVDLDKNAETAKKFTEAWTKFKEVLGLAGSDAMLTFLKASGFAEAMEKATNGIVENFSKIHEWAGKIGKNVKGFIEFVEKYFFKKDDAKPDAPTPEPDGGGKGNPKISGVGATAPPEDFETDDLSIVPTKTEADGIQEDSNGKTTEVRLAPKVKPKKVIEENLDDDEIDVSPAIRGLTSKENLKRIDENQKKFDEYRKDAREGSEILRKTAAGESVKVSRTARKAAKQTGETAQKAAKDVAKSTQKAADTVIDETQKTGKKLRELAEESAKKLAKAADEAASKVIPAANASEKPVAAPSSTIPKNPAPLKIKSWNEGEGQPSRRIEAVKTRGFRNNNFGNIIRNEKYQVFDTPEMGLQAAAQQFKYYANAGLKNLFEIYKTYAPKDNGKNPLTKGNDPKIYAENVAAYLSKKFGANITKTTALNFNDPEILKAVLEASIGQENGWNSIKHIDQNDINNAVARAVKTTYKSRAVRDENRVASTDKFERVNPVTPKPPVINIKNEKPNISVNAPKQEKPSVNIAVPEQEKPVVNIKQEKKPYFAPPYEKQNPDIKNISKNVSDIKVKLNAPVNTPLDAASESFITNSQTTNNNISKPVANITINISGAENAASETVRQIQEGLDKWGGFASGMRYAYSGGSTF